jgi:FlaA1/EpsC-like NDP-sugar epimerase
LKYLRKRPVRKTTGLILQVLLRHRQIVALCAYSGITAVSYVLAFLLRYEFQVSDVSWTLVWATLPLLVVLRAAWNWMFRLGATHWRFIGAHDVMRLGLAATGGTASFFVATWIIALAPRVPRSIIVIEWVVSAYLTAAVWLAYRRIREEIRHHRGSVGRNGGKRILIIGAGDAGALLAREMMRIPTGYRPIGFIDDDTTKHKTTLHGLMVLGGTTSLPAIVAAEQVDEVAIAVPSATPAELRTIVERCEAANIRFKVLPGLAAVLAGNVRVGYLRDLRIEDLLGRQPVRLELPELYDDLRGTSVLITGAAGSIGSELARQVALHDPGVMVLLDQAETPLFYLERELRERHPNTQMVFVVADIVDEAAVERVFHDFAPTRVFHAAAFKHVTMMQINPREAVRNNVLGTYLLADAAGRAGCAKFVLVSTDKAVEPTSVMGATKRLAEIALQEMQRRFESTTFAAVRFGNVLGSNGSVIPIFKQQIEEGRPLTVTHPEVTRYFMTIPEAVHLILQASLLPELRGSIAMLEMGEPVRILDLARNIIRLSGSSYEHGQDVVFTGLRWGEKLHEELVAPDEVTTATRIPKVKIVHPQRVSLSSVRKFVEDLETAYAEGRDNAVVASLASIFPSLNHRGHRESGDAPLAVSS